MAITIIKRDKTGMHCIFTNAIDVFHYEYNPTPEECEMCSTASANVSSGQPYVVSGTTIEEVLGKVFIDPENYQQDEIVSSLTPRLESEIIAEAETE